MKFKSLIIFALVFTIIYLVVIIVSSVFMFSFGPSNPSLYAKVLSFFVRYPFNYIQEGATGKESFVFLMLNGIFWGIVFYLISFITRKILKNK